VSNLEILKPLSVLIYIVCSMIALDSDYSICNYVKIKFIL